MLGNFNITVLIVATVLLILGLIIIGFFIVKSIEDSEYPPVISDCPDYWDVDFSNNGFIQCNKNNAPTNLGTIETTRCPDTRLTYPTASFNDATKSDADKLCLKHKWAKDCNIQWDGITNNSQACVNSTIK